MTTSNQCGQPVVIPEWLTLFVRELDRQSSVVLPNLSSRDLYRLLARLSPETNRRRTNLDRTRMVTMQPSSVVTIQPYEEGHPVTIRRGGHHPSPSR